MTPLGIDVLIRKFQYYVFVNGEYQSTMYIIKHYLRHNNDMRQFVHTGDINPLMEASLLIRKHNIIGNSFIDIFMSAAHTSPRVSALRRTQDICDSYDRPSKIQGGLMCSLLTSDCILPLTHWDRANMAAIFRTTFCKAFSWMKMYEFRLIFHWY